MMAKNDNGAGSPAICISVATGHAQLTVTLPAERVLADSTLIDQLIALIFDRLAQGPVELRVQPRRSCMVSLRWP